MRERQILSVCRDDELTRARTAALLRAGYQVLTADTTQAFDLLVAQKFDAVVLGENVPRREKVFLARLTRERWSTPVVLIGLPEGDPEIQDEVRVDNARGADALLGALASLLHERKLAGDT